MSSSDTVGPMPAIILAGTFNQAVAETVAALTQHITPPYEEAAITALARMCVTCIRLLSVPENPMIECLKLFSSAADATGVLLTTKLRLAPASPYITPVIPPDSQTLPGDVFDWMGRTAIWQFTWAEVDAEGQPAPGGTRRTRTIRVRSIPLPWQPAVERQADEYHLPYEVQVDETLETPGASPLIPLADTQTFNIFEDGKANLPNPMPLSLLTQAMEAFALGPDADADETKIHFGCIRALAGLLIFAGSAIHPDEAAAVLNKSQPTAVACN